MDITLSIKNPEDITYINSIQSNNDILSTALTIGIKALQMSQTTMTGNSYYEPIKEIIETNTKENRDTLENSGCKRRSIWWWRLLKRRKEKETRSSFQE